MSFNSIDIVQTESGFINTSGFSYWIDNAFIPHVHHLRDLFKYSGKAVLIIDGIGGHHNGIETSDLKKENIGIHFHVPHWIEQLHPLNIVIVSAESSSLTEQVMKMHQ